jgi:hypothetical protein
MHLNDLITNGDYPILNSFCIVPSLLGIIKYHIKMFHDKNSLPKTPTLIAVIYKDFFFQNTKKVSSEESSWTFDVKVFIFLNHYFGRNKLARLPLMETFA